MAPRVLSCAILVFGSGLCALLYQTTWLREFRLIFGSSTAASAAVLGIFMGGLGAGSALLGRRAERSPRPLAFYAKLELLIAASAALTPLLIAAIRAIYIGCGGTLALGPVLGTGLRLLLTALVLAAPTILMGGTLPAMARFAVGNTDTNRRGLALLYGMNTLGAVAGAMIGTFYLFEHLGNHATLYVACAANTVIALLALAISRGPVAEEATAANRVEETRAAVAPVPLVLCASAVTGFVFLLMELVWYRMLSPVLGGSAFTFGLILAVALLGIGLGGLLYSLCAGERRPTLNAFACTCALEALFVAVPFAAGDRIPLAAMLIQPLATLGFSGTVLGWFAICSVVVLPPAIVAGVQFPMLIGLLGSGRSNVASQTGAAYAWNTAGAIAGSLAGGFGFIPLLSAIGTWKLVIVLLAACAFAAAILGSRKGNAVGAMPSLFANVAALMLVFFATGPTAAWRHGQLDRMKNYAASPNEIRAMMHSLRRDVHWEADGIESSIGISKTNSLAFVVNGKCDGNAKSDAGTQVMCGLLAALGHPNPERAAVIGLGTGSTAGWLAAIPSMQRVDVMELEPVIARFAAECAPVNHDAMANDRLHVMYGDARELLVTGRGQYDVIVSEPSNPYRAGVASLFTREYYQTVAKKLSPGGVFAQWLQAYAVDLRTVRIFYTTLGAVFPHIETWRTQNGDLLLIASNEPITHNLDMLRERVTTEPFRSAFTNVWRVTDVEGVFSRYIGNASFAREVMQRGEMPQNTDDRLLLEFAFARMRHSDRGVSFEEMRHDAAETGTNRPRLDGELDWARVEQERLAMSAGFGSNHSPDELTRAAHQALAAALASYDRQDFAGALTHWQQLNREPQTLLETMLLAECLAERGDAGALRYIDIVRGSRATDADAIRARLLWRQNNVDEARQTVLQAIAAFRRDAWSAAPLINRTLNLAADILEAEPRAPENQSLYAALQEPLAVHGSDGLRRTTLMRMAVALDGGPAGERVLSQVEAAEPFVPWDFDFLKLRGACYTAQKHPRASDAEADLVDYLEAEPGGVEGARLRRKDRPARVASAAK